MDIRNYCEFIEGINQDPHKSLKGLTIRNLYQLKDHLATCPSCDKKVDDILAREPQEDTSNDPSLN